MAFETAASATLRVNVFNTIQTLIDNNKLSTWTVLSAFPESDPVFPCIVVNPAIVKPSIVALDKNCEVIEEIVVEIEYFALAKDGKKKIDEGRDNVMNIFLSNWSTLETYNLLPAEDPFEDSNIDTFIFGREKINTGASILRLQLR